ncbi:hypothetical protein [secondary endosymbiont of Ctenarytaina eucalypti]|uniref:hypothetical protein n=1 Tax=secondary endosymbiont of Ctenarytaina eucalypti TaxID=1199245 RepID=UPI0002ED3B6B|nr:hypothetical protein [secondary endosymbiont of Ctenarytaina eucalypti]
MQLGLVKDGMLVFTIGMDDGMQIPGSKKLNSLYERHVTISIVCKLQIPTQLGKMLKTVLTPRRRFLRVSDEPF